MLTKAQAGRVAALLAQKRSIPGSDHFLKRLVELDYSIQDAYRVLRTGKVERRPRWDEDYGNYEVRVRGRSFDDRDTRVVLGVTEAGTAVFVTIVEIARRKR